MNGPWPHANEPVRLSILLYGDEGKSGLEFVSIEYGQSEVVAELQRMATDGLVTLKMEAEGCDPLGVDPDGVEVDEFSLTEVGWACHRELIS
jgi:hypothetical protein